MTLAQFCTALIKYWIVILICVVVVGAGAYLKGRSTTPIFQATALVQVSVGSGSTNLDDLLASSQLIQTEVNLATSGPILREVASHYHNLSADDLATSVTVSAKPNALVFEIDVQNSSPTQAAALANDIAQTLIAQQTNLQKNSVRNDKVPPAQFLFLAQPALPPTAYIQPNTRLYGELGLAAGLLLGMLLAMLFDQIDPRIRTTKALLQEIPWPMLTSLQSTKEVKHMVDPGWQDANTEAYNMLLTRIAFLSIKDPLRFILVTSPIAGDGKSAVAANLAITMAKAGKKTWLIDANLRDPILHEGFNLPVEKAGFTNALLAFTQNTVSSSSSKQQPDSNPPTDTCISLDPYLHSIAIPHLRLMPSGPLPPNPVELLSSKAMDLLYEALVKSEAEVIIFDAHALLGLSDTYTLLPRVDGTLLVIDITRATRRNLAEAKTLLTQLDTRILGCVVNRLKSRNKAPKQVRRAANRTSPGKQINDKEVEAEPSDASAPTIKMRPVLKGSLKAKSELKESIGAKPPKEAAKAK